MKRFKLFHKKISIINEVERKNFLIRLIFFTLASFLYGIIYNTFLVPNNIVIGGMSGLAIVIKEITGLSTTVFINISTLILVIISYFVLGKDKAIYTIIGSIIFTLLLSFTSTFSYNLQGYLKNEFLIVLVSSISIGIANGIIYRSGFNTGGSDILASILNKYFKIPIGQCNSIINTFIIMSGAFLFGITKTIYAIFILTVSSKIIDLVMLGVNDSKMIYIKSKNWKNLEKYIVNDLKLGVTEIGNKGGIFIDKEPTLLVILPFDEYYNFKYHILKYDSKAFIAAHDCYAIQNGYSKKILPF